MLMDDGGLLLAALVAWLIEEAASDRGY